MPYRVTLIPGDGIGPELAEATRRVLDASGVAFEWEVQDAGEAVMAEYGTPLPEHVLESVRRNRVALKGPITTPVGGGFRSVNVTLRQVLGLYANLRPARSLKGVETRYEDVDLVIVRENTEDLYAGIEHMVGPRRGGEHQDHHPRGLGADRPVRVRVRRRERPAQGHGRPQGQHHEALGRAVPRVLPDGRRRLRRPDRVRGPHRRQHVHAAGPEARLYDVLVLPNLYGDIVSDLCAGLVGGLGVAPGANIGIEASVFEPVHGSAPKYAGQDKANPTALILSGVLMLRHLGEQAAAERVETALRDVVAEGRHTTYDLGGLDGHGRLCRRDHRAARRARAAAAS